MSIGNSGGGGGGGGESGVISHTEDQFGEKRKKEVASRRSVEPVVMAHTAHNNKRGSSLSRVFAIDGRLLPLFSPPPPLLQWQ